jgi:hypothetical protein
MQVYQVGCIGARLVFSTPLEWDKEERENRADSSEVTRLQLRLQQNSQRRND